MLKQSETVDSQGYGEIINSDDEVVSITGYEYVLSDPTSLTLSENIDDNIINLYYSRLGNLTYTVNYNAALAKIVGALFKKVKEQDIIIHHLLDNK